MNNVSEIARDYVTTIQIKEKLYKDFCILTPFWIAIALGILSSIFFYFIYNGPYTSISTFESLSIMTPVLLFIFSFQYSSFFLVNIITHDFTDYVLTYGSYYKKHLTEKEKHFLENMLDDSFKNIIKLNRRALINKLNKIEFDMAKKIFSI